MVSPEFEVKRPVLVGDTADVYLQRTLTILRNESINPDVAMEFAPKRAGVFCGVSEVKTLLARVLPETGREVWALEEGESVEAGEVALRVKAPYSSIGLYETAISGALSSGTAWATAARECVEAAAGTPVVSLGARHVHPNVVADMDYAAIVGGCVSCSTIQGARLAGVTPSGNMPHSLPILVGGSVAAMQAFDTHMPQEVPRIALVDTFRDEAEEALSVARAMGDKLRGVCLATPPERGGVTIDLVREVRSRLDQSDFRHVEIMVAGGFTPDRIGEFVAAEVRVNLFGVGAYIATAPPNTFAAEIQEIDGRPFARRGRIPGVTANPRLDRVI